MRARRSLSPVLAVGLLMAGCNADGPDPAPSEQAAPEEEAAASEATFTAIGVEPFEGPDTVAGGTVTITFVNEDAIGHNLTIEGLGEATATIDQGEQQQLTVELESGETYTLFCSVPGHRGAGMEIELAAS